MSSSSERLVIIGSGPAGLTAAIYAARADLQPLVVAGPSWGGLLQQTTDVENFPGYPQGVLGPEMMADLRHQAERYGARLVEAWADDVSLAREPDDLHRIRADGEVIETRALIVALGADHRRLGVPGEADLAGRGVSYCATCDAPFFRNGHVVVVGGGDSAMEEAQAAARFAERVTILHRKTTFRASPIMRDRALSHPRITALTPYSVSALVAGPNGRLESVTIEHLKTGDRIDLAADGVFVAIGHLPQSGLLAGQVELDEEGYIVVMGRSSLTSVPGVFAAGDVVDKVYRQAVTAAGLGCQAALDATRYLEHS